jgi:hypothetical protein
MPPDKDSDTTSLLNSRDPPLPDSTPKKRGIFTRLFSHQRVASGRITKEPTSSEPADSHQSDYGAQHGESTENHDRHF